MLHADAASAFRARAREGKVCLGVHMSSMSPQIVELMGLLGLDFVIVSSEVESLDLSRMEDMIRAAQSAGTVPSVKIRRFDPKLVDDAMSAGAPMVMVPHVKTRAMLDEMIRASRFEPFGTRALCPVARYTGYGSRPLSESRKTANEDHTLIPILEDREALDHLDEIISCEDVDIFEIGPFDMSQSLGLARPEASYDNPETMRAVEQIGKVARKYGKGLLAPLWMHPGCDTAPKLVQLQIDRLVSVGVNCFYAIEVLILCKLFRDLLPVREARRT